MQRLTITLDDDLVALIDGHMAARGYTNRSEAVRDLVRAGLAGEPEALPTGECVATLSYVYDHEARDLARRLMGTQHDHHGLVWSTLHVHLDHDACLEVAVLRGSVAAVKRFANSVLTERGVRHGTLHLVPVAADHHHSHDDDVHPHHHLRPVG
ncbi:MAG: nickel-responsive transcriptional regulator NikR [Alphaproteobacteria bacterium]|nr:nickel-responsive transcriptional regulator NikR [Alphaproteobacteria bacterium]TAD87831.1 MAG: nickel-responsive transcriptional regulator NikR [Alphaproteobacteria bacterium]